MIMLFIILLLASESAGCPTDCAECSQAGNEQKCDNCIGGYWLRADNYCSLCPANCEQCKNATHCTKCKANFWDIQPNSNCASPCRETCTASGCVDLTGYCYACPPGFYGSYCDRNCDLCLDGLCERQKCKVGCNAGFYESKDNDFECKACSDHCASCQNYALCKQCEHDFYLFSYPNDDKRICLQCSSSCEECINITHCTKCRSNFWDIRPNVNCGSPCSETCTASGCDDTTGHCYGCHPGFYGSYCDSDCDLCLHGHCEQRKCKVGCKEGYYESEDNDFECKECNDHCASCNNLTHCKQCEKGFYLFNYPNDDKMFCLQCSSSCEECISQNECICNAGKYGPTCSKDCSISNCKRCIETDNVVTCTECISGYSLKNGDCFLGTDFCTQYCSNGCDSNGNCLGGCQDGWTGIKCTVRCNNRCRKCDQNNINSCITCEGDFYGTACTEPCSSHCLIRSGLVKCDINNGTCLHGCVNGYWGDGCDKQCSDGCNSVSCNQSNGFCDTCFRTYYGDTCHHTCSEHCVDKGAPSAICNKTNGKCVEGCENGYSGDTCQLSAIKTTTSTEKFSTHYDDPDQCDGYTKPFLLGILTCVGICLLLVVAFIVACLRIRKMRQKPNSSKSVMEEREYENTTVTMQGVSSAETDGGIRNAGYNLCTIEAAGGVYEGLDRDTREDQHLYSGLERQTNLHGTRIANMK